MAVNLSFIGGAGWQFFDDNGDPLSGGKIFTYAAGTTTPLVTYTSRNGDTPNANPIILDAAGRTPQQIWSTEGLLYKYVITTSTNVLVRTWDNIGGAIVASDLAQSLANASDVAQGDALIGFRQSNPSGNLIGSVDSTVHKKLQEIVSVKDFGAVGDGVADDTVAIQNAINAAIYNGSSNQSNGNKAIVYIPPGNYKTTDTIHLGYGVGGFSSVFVEGAGKKYRGESPYSGTAIFPTFNDRPAFNFQGARSSSIKNLTIMGVARTYYSGLSYAQMITESNWTIPGAPASADSQYAPYAAITVDAYSGAEPAIAYPVVSYPAFLGSTPQYGKQQSSDILLEDVYIEGFVAGVVIKPSNDDNNADFTKIERCSIVNCKYGISVGHSQSRTVDISNVPSARNFVGITNNTHGVQRGQLGGTIRNWASGETVNLLKLNCVWANSPTFINCYSELTWRIGDIEYTSSNDPAVEFIDCSFSFTMQGAAKNYPLTTIGGNNANGCLKFTGCSLNQFKSVFNTNKNAGVDLSIVFDGCKAWAADRFIGPITTPYIAIFQNAYAGGIVNIRGGLIIDKTAAFKEAAIDTGDLTARVLGTRSLQTRNFMTPVFVDTVEDYDGNLKPLTRNAHNKTFTQLNGIRSGLTLTLDFSAIGWTTDQIEYSGGAPGDIITTDFGHVFLVRSLTGTTVVAELQNGYVDNGGGSYTVTGFPANPTLFFTVLRYFGFAGIAGDLTTGSADITNVLNVAQLAIGDYLMINYARKNVFNSSGSTQPVKITNIVGTTVTVSRTAAVTQTKYPLPVWIAKPPANV